jgi:hypothetical protein
VPSRCIIRDWEGQVPGSQSGLGGKEKKAREIHGALGDVACPFLFGNNDLGSPKVGMQRYYIVLLEFHEEIVHLTTQWEYYLEFDAPFSV